MMSGKGKYMKKFFQIIFVCILALATGIMPAAAAPVRGGTISVRPVYSPGLGVNIPKRTVIGTTRIYKRPIGGFYPTYGGVYYSGTRYTSKRNRVASYDEVRPQQTVVKEVYRTPPITSCSGLAFYDKDGNIIRCR